MNNVKSKTKVIRQVTIQNVQLEIWESYHNGVTLYHVDGLHPVTKAVYPECHLARHNIKSKTELNAYLISLIDFH